MRASDLIGVEVFDRTGGRLGIVTDLRCTLDGPLRGTLAQPRVSAILVSRGHFASLLGYDRREQQGPWLVRVIVRWFHRDLRIIEWERVDYQQNRMVVAID